MAVVETSRFHKGMKIEVDGAIWEIVEFKHSKMAQRSPIVTARLKNIATGAVQEKKFRAGDAFNVPDIEKRTMQYLYRDDTTFYFMDSENFEQFPFGADAIGDAAKFLREQQEVSVQMRDGELIGVELPASAAFEVTQTEPGVRGDTVSSTTTPATIETGAVVAVPLFINVGDVIKVDTRNGNYIERVKS